MRNFQQMLIDEGCRLFTCYVIGFYTAKKRSHLLEIRLHKLEFFRQEGHLFLNGSGILDFESGAKIISVSSDEILAVQPTDGTRVDNASNKKEFYLKYFRDKDGWTFSKGGVIRRSATTLEEGVEDMNGTILHGGDTLDWLSARYRE